MSPEFIASAVVPLVVATLNLLVAGYALSGGFKDQRSILFAAGPAGVGIWALAWFVFVFNPDALSGMRSVGVVGGMLCVVGFAADAFLDLSPTRRWPVALAMAATAGITASGLWLYFDDTHDLFTFGFFGRLVVATSMAGITLARLADVVDRRHGDRRLARWSLFAVAGTAVVFGGFALLTFVRTGTAVDILLLAVLLSEVLALVYMTLGRVQVHTLFSRAVTYSGLSLLVAGLAAMAYALLGYTVDIVVVSVTVMIALLASAMYMALGDRLSRRVERLMFPDRARLQNELVASHGEVRAMRRRLERVEKLAIAGELAASVAHEIKNPLAPIRGYAQMLAGRLEAVGEDDRAQFEKGLRIIRTETDRIDERIQELLVIARGGRETASRETHLTLNRVVSEAAAVAEAEPGVTSIECRLDSTIENVVGDPDEIRGALLNLMKNAAEAMVDTDGSQVEVITRREGELAVVLVIDEGPGVPTESEDKVFGAFYTTKEGGTGLGLAIARSAVEAAGGTLALSSRDDRRGAVARIELDLEAEPLKEQSCES